MQDVTLTWITQPQQIYYCYSQRGYFRPNWNSGYDRRISRIVRTLILKKLMHLID